MSTNVHAEFLNDYISEHIVFTHAELMDAFDNEKINRPGSRQVPHLLRDAGYINKRPRINGKPTSLCHPIDMQLREINEAYLARSTPQF